ncbi:MAG: right-handed parallel beta-helix repeat-containing protein [Spirochaetales bacterium]|nr:right-handed parallel beta-helix repeat-containing protein [Spirochaetales bacterium]
MKKLPNILFICMIILFSTAGLCLVLLFTSHTINTQSHQPKVFFLYFPYILILTGLIAGIWRIILIKKTSLIKWISSGFVILSLLLLLLGTLRIEYEDIWLSDYYLIFFIGSLFPVIVLLKKPKKDLPFTINASLLLGFELSIVAVFVLNVIDGAFHLSFVILFLLLIFPSLYFIKFRTISWLKWVSLAVLTLLDIYYIIGLIFFRKGPLFTSNSIFLFFFSAFMVIFNLILFIPNHRWTRFVFAFYMLLTILGLTGFSITKLPQKGDSYHLYYEDRKLIMQQKDHKNRKVIYQENIRDKQHGRTVYIEERFFIFRIEKEIHEVLLTGVWYEYDDSGSVSQLSVYSDEGALIFQGKVDEEKVVSPETVEELVKILNNTVPDQIIELNGEYSIESNLEIAGKNNFTITPVMITRTKGRPKPPVIKNPSAARSGLVLNDCENVRIDGIELTLTNESAHYPGIITLYKCKNIEIRNCTIQGKAEYGIYIHGSCRNIRIIKNTIKGYRQYGCFTEYGDSVFERNSFENANKVQVENIHFTKNDVMQVYKDSFDLISGSMYESNYYSPLDFQTYSLGMYMGTPGHMEFDSGMVAAANKFSGSKGLSDLYDNFLYYLLEYISGVPVYVIPDKHDRQSQWHLDETDMTYYNPEFISWAGKNLLPEPDDGVFGTTFQQLYDSCYRRFFRVLAETYAYIQDNLDMENEVSSFVNEVKQAGTPKYYLQNLFSHLQFTTDSEVVPDFGYEYEYPGYEGEDPGYSEEYNGYDYVGNSGLFVEFYDIFSIDSELILTPPKAVGFWFRRYIDTSSDEVWDVLTKIFKKYDLMWYNENGMYHY